MLNFNGGLTINVNEWAGMQAEQKGGEIYAHVGQGRSFSSDRSSYSDSVLLDIDTAF